jgi:uncharacterized protein involved in response to NO
MRAWKGPALLSFGFRPFFLFGSLWAAVAMVLWIAMLTGKLALPIASDPVSWHAHALLIGYLGAIVAGFLLTAVPNWTGRLPVFGWRLGALVLLWLAGRIVMLISSHLPDLLVAVLDLAFLVVLAAWLLREIVAGKNWRNLIMVGVLLLLILGGVVFHVEVGQGGYAARGYGLRLVLAAAILMISIIGGRIVPSFTRNWLVKVGRDERPTPPMAGLDRMVLLATAGVLLIWVLIPEGQRTGLALVTVGLLHLVRLVRWQGHHTLSEPLVWVLHAGYLFVPLGALALGLSILMPHLVTVAAAQHIWMAGAIGLMTLAVMTRATLGHTGQALKAGAPTVALYICLIAAVLTRIAGGYWLEFSNALYVASACFWCAAFLGFCGAYGPALLSVRRTG